MIEINTILAVIDPTTDKQYALQRAIRTASATGAKIHAHLCISPALEAHDPVALERVERARFGPWLENIVEEVRSEGVEITSELDWNEDWRAAIAAAAKRVGADFIIKGSHRRSTKERMLMTSSDLALLETAPCSVQLVPSEVVADISKALIAVDTRRDGDKHVEIFDGVVEFGKTIASTAENGELQVVYAYSASDSFEHVTDIAKRVGVETEFVHVTGGAPENAIAKIADEVGAEIIVIGVPTSSTLANRLFGNIIDKLLHKVEQDILVYIPPRE